jgi:hypothetical protein
MLDGEETNEVCRIGARVAYQVVPVRSCRILVPFRSAFATWLICVRRVRAGYTEKRTTLVKFSVKASASATMTAWHGL